jgi:ABC-type Fe3+-hydroxamate transport system, periplasmic component
MMKKILWMILALMLALGMLAGCGTTDNTAPSGTESVTTATQETVPTASESTEAETLRIVSTVPSATEILFELGVGDWIVGVDISSTYPEATADIEKVGDYNGFDVEKIVSLAPDVVFAGNALQADQIAQLEEAELHVVSVDPTYYEDIAASITLIGAEVGRVEEAAALNAEIAEAAEAVQTSAAAITDRPTIYYVMFIGDSGNWTSGEGSFINTVMEMCGATCVTAGSESAWLEYPVEDLVTADPDILIVSAYVTEDQLKTQTGYAGLTAVQEGHYYFINPDTIERPGPRIAEAMQAIQANILSFLGE